MAFDAGMLSFVINEINEYVGGGRVEKIYQPARDEFVFIIRGKEGSRRLLVNAGSRCPRIGLTEQKSENPMKAPMLCMLFRKHLQGAIFECAEQLGFERAARLVFDTTDELGFRKKMHIIVEMMGKYSNIVFTDDSGKIINILRQIDFTDSSRRQMLPGMIYELPPRQNKLDPFTIDKDTFNRLAGADPERLCEKFIVSAFAGISPLAARELAHKCGGHSSATLRECSATLCDSFFTMLDNIASHNGLPNVIFDENGKPREYSFFSIEQYGKDYKCVIYDTFGQMLDVYFEEKSRDEKLSQKASDIQKIIANSTARIQKKLSIQLKELDDCAEGEKYRLWGDLVTANIYCLKRGMTGAALVDYNTGDEVNIPLDSRLTPAQNAQRYYKRYAKSKSAKEHLSKQIELSKSELSYIESVGEALSHAVTEKEMSEIRSELYHSGYASKFRQFIDKKQQTPSYITFRTGGGYTVLCGKNNTANDWLTFRKADRNDWWFHAKNMPGSHVIMVCVGLPEPSVDDFTDAAMIAAVYSKACDMTSAEIDYTKVRNIKKPPESKPGYVIYHTNWSATVNVDKAKVESMKE